jgi:Recombination endonuclease VII/HNH endonuclease
MVKSVELTFDCLSEVLNYDAKTGSFTWKVSVNSRAKVGQRAGVWQRMQNGKDYYSITYQGRKLSGAQVAWLLYYGEWPDRSVFFIDGDTKNLKISNLKMAEHKSEKVLKEDGSVKYKISKDQQRHYGLMRYYGISIGDYAEMYRKQDGKCAICHQPETTMDYRGTKKDLAVDHCHETGAVRELLCYACNTMLGQAKDRIEVLLAGADYIRKHSVNKDLGNPSPQTGLADVCTDYGDNPCAER